MVPSAVSIGRSQIFAPDDAFRATRNWSFHRLGPWRRPVVCCSATGLRDSTKKTLLSRMAMAEFKTTPSR